ncbi:alpha-ketoglutarate-dependent dioxygenase alkB homolog 7, mitochondrial [Culicoides brevitarsis]|uniref:alpha-ketoglutarate-dependent dioxygenase alkB homolog 7, mitochondrial n=1 Tax=Culicoides brevitarsis TaxID=469753 RepID=UPI00307CC341
MVLSRILLRNSHRLIKQQFLLTRKSHVITRNSSEACENTFDFVGNWPLAEKELFLQDMIIQPDFITPHEEDEIMKEIDPYLKRLKYEFDHWDDAIQGFRETERQKWYPDNKKILNRVLETAFPQESVLPHVHVLDLAEDGHIKPHVDSVRYCGTTISGISLLSDAVMRLVRIDEKEYKDNAEYRNQPSPLGEKGFYVDVLLKRRSLYIMSYTSRYNFTHEVLGNEKSVFKGSPVKKTRRVSIICRNEPRSQTNS